MLSVINLRAQISKHSCAKLERAVLCVPDVLLGFVVVEGLVDVDLVVVVIVFVVKAPQALGSFVGK